MFKDLVNLFKNILTLSLKYDSINSPAINKSLNKKQLKNNTCTNNLVKHILVWKKIVT